VGADFMHPLFLMLHVKNFTIYYNLKNIFQTYKQINSFVIQWLSFCLSPDPHKF